MHFALHLGTHTDMPWHNQFEVLFYCYLPYHSGTLQLVYVLHLHVKLQL